MYRTGDHSVSQPMTWLLFLCAALTCMPASAGIDVLFVDGFEGGGTQAWEQPPRYVVFEGFYNPG